MSVEDIFTEGPSLVDEYIPLSTDINRWPDQILEQFFLDCPYLKDSLVNTKFTKVDSQTQSAIGSVEVTAGQFILTFPLIIKRGRLSPFDVFIYQGQYFPATESRIRMIVSGEGLVWDTTKRDETSGSLVEATQTPEMMTDQVTQTQEKTSSVLSKLAFTVNSASKDKLLRYIRSNPDLVALSQYPDVSKVFQRLVDLPVMTDEQYSASLSDLIPIGVLQIRKNDDGTYTLLTSSDKFFHPVEQNMSIDELQTYLGTILDKSWPVIDATNRRGEVTISMMDNSGDISVLKTKIEEELVADKPGVYTCKVEDGSLVSGTIVPLYDYNLQPTQLKLFYNSSYYAVQDRIAGKQSYGYDAPKGTEPAPGLVGAFFHKTKPIAVGPFTITTTSYTRNENGFKSWTINSVALDGSSREFYYTDYYKGWVLQKEEGVPLNKYNVSMLDFVFVSLDEPVNLVKYDNYFSKEASVRYGNRLKVRYSDGRYLMDGAKLSKYASVGPILLGSGSRKSFNFNDMSHSDSKFFLSTLGYMPPRAEEILKKARHLGSIELHKVAFPETIIEKKNELIPRIKKIISSTPKVDASFIKQAATAGVEEALDQTLALNLLAPENILYFVSSLPDMELTVQKLAGLLILARLGLKSLSERGVRDTMQGLEQILTILKLYKLSLEGQPETPSLNM